MMASDSVAADNRRTPTPQNEATTPKEFDLPPELRRIHERLRHELSQFEFLDSPPLHSSYDGWHFRGRRRRPRSVQTGSSRPSSVRTRSEWDAGSTDDGKEKEEWVVARVGSSALRLEREYKLVGLVTKDSDPECKHFLHPLHFARLPARHAGEQQLSVAVYDTPGRNYLGDVASLGPNTYVGSPDCVTPYRPSAGGLPLLTFLDFAVGATETCEILHHGCEIVHGELRPDAFHYNIDTHAVRLINFGSGARTFEHGLTSAGWSSLMSERGVEHKLQFIAPEQTGRLPAEPDSRTDIYSLGVIFWTLLTGQAAISGKLPLDIMQSLLSRRISFVSTVRNDVPEALCHIIQKMTQRSMDERYNSMSGVKHDLINLKKILTEGDKEALASFKVGINDVSSFFNLPTHLVGREKQQNTILEIIENAARRSAKAVPISRKGLMSLTSGSSVLSMERNDTSTMEEITSDSTSSRSMTIEREGVRDVRLNSIPESTMTDGINMAAQLSETVESPITLHREDSDDKKYESISSHDSRGSLQNESGQRSSSSFQFSSDSGSLLRTAQKIKRKGRTELIAIEGAAGHGKSSVIQSITPTARKHGYFTSSKFDQVRTAPFEPVLRVMSSLFRQIFSEPNVNTPFHENIRTFIKPFWSILYQSLELPAWLLSTNSHGQRLTSSTAHQTAPVGPTPERKSCALHSTQEWLRAGGSNKSSRFMHIFLDVFRLLAVQKFICFCLDDVQFADSESLELLQMLVNAHIPVVIILTFREEEVLTPQITQMLSRATRVKLNAFTEDQTAQYVAHTLHRPVEYTLPLVAVVQEKTRGNPFFVRELLDAAYRKKCIYYCWRCSQWEFNLDRLFEHFASPNSNRFSSNDFIVRRMKELPIDAQALLAWAAIMGNSFSFNIMKRIMACECSKASPPEYIPPSSLDPVAGLASTVAAFIMMPTESEDRFKFAHDRYVSAANQLCDQYRREEMHYVIALASMKHDPYDPITRPTNVLFEQAHHVSEAVAVIKLRVAKKAPYRDLLFQAAETARENGARALGLTFFNSCLHLLPADPWNDDGVDTSYSETLTLLTRAAEAHWHMSRFEEGTRLLSEITSRARDANDKAPAAMILSRTYEQLGENDKAYACLKQALADLGVIVSVKTLEASDDDFQALLPAIQSSLKSLDLAGFSRTSLTRETQSLAALLVELTATSFWTDATLFYQSTLKLTELFVQYGFFPQIGIGLVHLANIIISRFNLVSLGVEFGRVALEIFDAFPSEAYTIGRGQTLHVNFLGHIRQDMRECLSQLQIALQASYASGDKIVLLLNAGIIACHKVWASENLGDIETYIQTIGDEFPDWQDSIRGGTNLVATRQFVRALQGKTFASNSTDVLSDEFHSTEKYIQHVKSITSCPDRFLTIYRSWEIEALYRFGHYKRALEIGELVLPVMDSIWSMRFTFTNYAFLALSMLAVAREDPGFADREACLKTVSEYRARIEIISSYNPVNYLALLKLIDAEVADVTQQYGNVLREYEAAINHSVLNGLLVEEAHSLELYGDWMARRGASRPARSMILDAISAYRRLGASAKAEQVSEKHEFLLFGTRSLSKADASTQTDFNDIGHTALKLDRITSHAIPTAHHNTVQEWLHPGHNSATSGAQPTVETSGTLSNGLSAVGLDIIDLTSILESSQLLSSELDVDRLLSKFVKIIVDSTGADLCGLVVEDDNGGWCIAATGSPRGVDAPPAGIPLDAEDDPITKQVTPYVLRFKDQVYLRNVLDDERFANVPTSWLEKNPEGASMIALPILHGDDVLLGALYCQALPNTFTERTVTLLKLLVNQIAISIANALLFKQVERVSGRNASMVEVQKQALAQAREAEKKAKIAEAKAMEMVRLKDEAAKAKSMFLANVSHELRTPLNGVIGMSEMLKATPLNKEQEEHADSIRVCADTLLSVINDILDFSKLEAGKMRVFSIPLSLTQTISEVVRALSYTNLERNLKTIEELELDPNLIVMGDPVRLHQILMNLMSNAYKFTSKGSVTVRAKVDAEIGDDIQVTVSVSDTGIGISEEAQKKLFLPFSQADSSTARSYGGTGLGLSICKAIIENVMKGRIWLESEYGVGTTVSFSLPFKRASPSTNGQVHQGSPSARDIDPMSIFTPPATEMNNQSQKFVSLAGIPRNEVKVAIAEDNMVNQRVAMHFVRKLGFTCEAFGDGQQAVDALDRASKEGKPFHLVLMDVQMPVLDGYNATREIRKHADPNVRDVLVIAMTASAIRGDREKCLEAGMNNYLAKPVRADTLKQMLESYLHQPAKAMPNLQEEANHLVKKVTSGTDDGYDSSRAGTPTPENLPPGVRNLRVPERPRSRSRETAIHLTAEEMSHKDHESSPDSPQQRQPVSHPLKTNTEAPRPRGTPKSGKKL